MKTLAELQAEYRHQQTKWRAMIRSGHWNHDKYAYRRDQMDAIDLEMTRVEMEERK